MSRDHGLHKGDYMRQGEQNETKHKPNRTTKGEKQKVVTHVLFNNAGLMAPLVDQKTLDGYDLQFGTNVLGHHFFTTLLLPTLIHSAKNSPLSHGHARVINTFSAMIASAPKGGIVYEALRKNQEGAEACKKLGSITLYAHSKLGNVLFSNALAKKYAHQGIISVSLHPGSLQTELHRNLCMPAPVTWLLGLLAYPVSYGALTQLWAGTMPEGVQLNGKYLIPWVQIGDPGPLGRDKAAAEKLWAWLED